MKRRDFKNRECPKCGGNIGVIRRATKDEPTEMLGCVSNRHVQVSGTYGYDLNDFPKRKKPMTNSDLIPTNYVKVVLKTAYVGGRTKTATVYLENAKQIEKGGINFISGYQCNKNGEAKTTKVNGEKAAILHLIQLGFGVTVVPQLQSKKYGDLHDAA